jgi:hypothetical protein
MNIKITTFWDVTPCSLVDIFLQNAGTYIYHKLYIVTSQMAPVIYFPGALIYSAGFNVNQNVKKKIFLNKNMFQFFS